MVIGGGDEMRTAWPDGVGTGRSRAGGAPAAPRAGIDVARLVGWLAVIVLAVVFWAAVGLLVALAV